VTGSRPPGVPNTRGPAVSPIEAAVRGAAPTRPGAQATPLDPTGLVVLALGRPTGVVVVLIVVVLIVVVLAVGEAQIPQGGVDTLARPVPATGMLEE
jgi:hypothetical protein